MSRGVNKVTLIGRLGQNPEVKFLQNGNAVANVSLATSEEWKNKETGEPQKRVEWHRVKFFNRMAEIVGEYLKKGAQIYVEGKLQTRKWQDNEGVERYTTEIIANEMQMLGGKSDGADRGGQSNDEPQTRAPTPGGSVGNDDGFDDSIPF